MREPEAAVAILRTRGSDPTILLMRRAEREGDAWSGHWSLPGGRRDGCDADPLETAVRELHEECGIRISRDQMSAVLPLTVARRASGSFLLVAPFVFDIEAQLPTVLDPREAAGAMWLPVRTLLDPAQHSLQRAPGLPEQMWFPAIALPGAPLWGFTYRLLADWLGMSPRDCATTGFDVARMVLDFLLSRGLTLRTPWRWTAPSRDDVLGPVRVAAVSGPIPAGAVIEYLSAPGPHVARINRLEARPEYLSIHGLAFEEYLIEAQAE
jgi:8-oxo-dGTP pyrophosphatase MutT (NUDIX family)